MLSSLLRPSRSQRRRLKPDQASFISYGTNNSPNNFRKRNEGHRQTSSPYPGNGVTEDENDEGTDDYEAVQEEEDDDNVDEEEESESDGIDDDAPLLPIFSTAHLDALPVFVLTHAIRDLVTARCETVLSWEQLRSPQVSQFLLKPIQQEIRANHFNAATQYALMANRLQFDKESSLYPGNSGTNSTRAMLCELLAIKLLKEYSTRELIDALSYDFDPLQGQVDNAMITINNEGRPLEFKRMVHHKPARISCLEIAIRAQAKRLLAHPVVVQQLEAIWSGTIVFHSAADNMHRKSGMQRRHHGSEATIKPGIGGKSSVPETSGRRAVTLYNPKDASLFKLSRLRVPRYRNILSTMSFAVLLGLFLAVLIERTLEISTLEVIFWFWAAGYMLDEVVGFNEQGFSLYIASFWNTFDLGILLILFVHLCLRVYGIAITDVGKHRIADMAYDVLAADAILLFPRLFSILDHYRYFSQLLIAFRMMAADLLAVLVLIIISCSGFFVALTLSFGNDKDTPSSVAYALLQLVMGFTPAAWERWVLYNPLGKAIITLFLFICHFLIVTILVTVLSNSLSSIMKNANEEHQFVFAVNTVSNVKSDALFSYVAPTNILQWLLTPLRYILPFRQYLKLNRTIIKITHFPILFSIFVYEKTILQSSVFDRIDVVEYRGRQKRQYTSRLPRLVREPSIATFRQDRALEEVFKRPFDSTLRSAQQSRDRRQTSNVVSNWMKDMGEEVASPPAEQDPNVVDKLERRRLPARFPLGFQRTRDFSRRTMSVVSDPEEFRSYADYLSPGRQTMLKEQATPSAFEGPSQQTDHDGDDELQTIDNDDEDKTLDQQSTIHRDGSDLPDLGTTHPVDYFAIRHPSKMPTPETGSSVTSLGKMRLLGDDLTRGSPVPNSPKRRPKPHVRNVSSATMIYKPESGTDQSASQDGTTSEVAKGMFAASGSGTRTPASKRPSTGPGRRTPRRAHQQEARMRPALPTRDNLGFASTPNFAHVIDSRKRGNELKRRSSLEMDLVSDIGDNKAIGGGYVGAIPASFATQMAMATGAMRSTVQRNEDQAMFGRLMMARMNSLEEGFREVIHEMRENFKNDGTRSRSPEKNARGPKKEKKAKEKERDKPVNVETNKENEDPNEVGKPQLDGSQSGEDLETQLQTAQELSFASRQDGENQHGD